MRLDVVVWNSVLSVWFMLRDDTVRAAWANALYMMGRVSVTQPIMNACLGFSAISHL
jgi:hypothetical protein